MMWVQFPQDAFFRACLAVISEKTHDWQHYISLTVAMHAILTPITDRCILIYMDLNSYEHTDH